MRPWELEKKVIDTIALELQVPRVHVRPTARLVDDLRGDALSIARLVTSLESQLGVSLDGPAHDHAVWDIVKTCHKAWWRGANEPAF